MVQHKIYISGKYRARSTQERDVNVARARALAIKLWQHEIAAICPHMNTKDFEYYGIPSDIFIEGDLLLLEDCNAVLTIPGWEHSEGAREEVSHAKKKDIPIFHDIDVLLRYFGIKQLLD